MWAGILVTKREWERWGMFSVTYSPPLPLLDHVYCACATVPISAKVPLLVSHSMMDCLKLLTFSTLTMFKGIETSFNVFHLTNLFCVPQGCCPTGKSSAPIDCSLWWWFGKGTLPQVVEFDSNLLTNFEIQHR